MKTKYIAAPLAAVIALMGVSTTASATSGDGILDGSGVTYGSGGWYGAYHVGSEVAYCGDLGSAGPSHADGWTVETSGYTFHKQTAWDTDLEYPYPTSGDTASVAELAQMAYALDKYSSTAPTVAQGVALEHLVRVNTIDGTVQTDREEVRWDSYGSPVTGAATWFNTISADAARNAGPYTVEVDWVDEPTRPGDTGTAQAFILTGSGAKLLNTSLSVSAVGGTTASTINTGSTGTALIKITTADPGSVELSVSASGLTSIWPTLYLPTNRSDDVQRMLAAPAGQHPTVSARVSAEVELWAPKVATKTSQQLVNGETDLFDTVMISEGKPGSEFSGTTALYGPFTAAPTDAAELSDDMVVGVSTFEGTYDSNGSAEVVSSTQHVSRPGFYVWSEQLAEIPGETAPTSPAGPTGSETTVNVSPTITTAVSDQSAIPGQTISDTVDLAGLADEVGGTDIEWSVSGGLYGPVAAVDGSCAEVDWTDAPLAASIDEFPVDASMSSIPGVGEYTIPQDAEDLGCYTYTETLTAQVEGEEPLSWTHDAGDEAQTSLVSVPVVSTSITDDKLVVAPGTEISDTIVVEGAGGSTGEMEAVLYGYITPEANQQCTSITDEDWRTAITDGDVTALGSQTLAIEGDGTYVTDPITLDAETVGCATWYESATFTDAPGLVVETPYGVETETAIALAPELVTTAHADVLLEGEPFYDTVEVTGTYGESGVITGSILGPVPGLVQSDGSVTCEFVDWTQAEVVGEIPALAITGDGTYEIEPVDTAGAGCYTAVETLVLDRGDVVSVHPAGVPAQTMFFDYLPEVEEIVSSGGAAAASGGGIATGDVPEQSSSALAVAAAGVGFTALSAAGIMMARRRRTQVR